MTTTTEGTEEKISPHTELRMEDTLRYLERALRRRELENDDLFTRLRAAAMNPNVERVVLRAAVGRDNYAEVEKIATALDELESRGVICPEGVAALTTLLANEIVTAAVLREHGIDLSLRPAFGDTAPLEDPHT